jgi:hypothetical protein
MRREMKPVISAELVHRDEYELAEDESLKLGMRREIHTHTVLRMLLAESGAGS